MDEKKYIGRWINSFRIIPYLIVWGIWALLALSFLTLIFDSIDNTPDIFIIIVAITTGFALSALGRKDEAISAYGKALEIKSDYASAVS